MDLCLPVSQVELIFKFADFFSVSQSDQSCTMEGVFGVNYLIRLELTMCVYICF